MLLVFAVLLSMATPETATVPKSRPTLGAAASSAPVAPTVAMRARAFFDEVRTDKIDRTLLTRAFSAELTPEVTATLARGLAPLGEPGAFVERAKHDVDGVTTYDYAVALGTAAIALTIGIDDATDAIARFYVRRTAGVPAR